MFHRSQPARTGGPGGSYRLDIRGLPAAIPQPAAAVFRSRLDRHTRELFDETGLEELRLLVRRGDPGSDWEVGPWPDEARSSGGFAGPTGPWPDEARSSGGFAGPTGPGSGEGGDTESHLDLQRRMSYFTPVQPSYRLDQVVLPEATLEQLHLAVDTVRLRHQVFDQWGLRSVEPHPRTAINLHGSPGVGKTLVAHALAAHLGRSILPARTSQLESKYHGEGGKYLAALFAAAAQAGAVLFIDEAESLLSRRFESVSQGSEHAVNTLRSELIQHLDRYEGVIIFATNLVESYDAAINSRLHHVHLPEPDRAARLAIWRAHLPAELPLAADVSLEHLADTEGIVGRDIKRVVIAAAVRVAREGRPELTHADLGQALDRFLADRPQPVQGDGVTPEERSLIIEGVRQHRERPADARTAGDPEPASGCPG